MNVFIKDCLMVEIDQKFCCDIPTVKMKIGDQHLLFVYREWRVDGRDGTEGYPQQLVRWKTLVDTWRKLRGKLLVMGDFNLEFWRCVTQQHRDQAPMKDYLMDNIIMKGYVQLLKDITRSQRDSSSCIDHIYTNSCEHLYMDSLQNVNIVGYDHNSISIRLKLKGVVHEVQIIETQAVKTLDPGRFSELWSQIDFSSFWRTSSVDEAVEIYTEAVKACLDNLIPLRKIQIRPDNAPWLTKELLAEMKVRNEMRDEAMRTGDEDKWQDFKVFRNKLRIKCDKIKKNHLNEGLHGDDSKRNWRNIMAMSGLSTKKSSKIWLKENGESIDDPKEVAEHLNNFFVSKVNKIVSTHPPNPEEMKSYTEEYVKGKNIEKLNFRCVDTEAVLKIIHDIKPTGASGTDGISMIMIKKLSMVLAPFLTRIVNLSLMSSTYPSHFKTGTISPVPKSGCLQEAKNWLAVVLLNSASKVLERVVNIQLKDHLRRNTLISPEQHAYQPGKSTASALLELDSMVAENMERKRAFGMLLLDMSAAFNLCCRSILIPKLKLLD